MIVISVSLTIIGLVVWVIGDNYHFASDLMAGQEIDAMTPKQGYNIVSFDDSQPVGAKLKLLDHAGTNETAIQLKEQHVSSGVTILIFNSSLEDNKKLVGSIRSAAAQTAQEKASAAASATKAAPVTPSNLTSVSNTNATTMTLGNQTSMTFGNQTSTNGSSKSVNLIENMGITSRQ